MRHLRRFIGAALLQALIMGIPIVAGALLIGFVLLNQPVDRILRVIVTQIAITPLLLFFMTRYAVVFPAVLVEDIAGSLGLWRSWRLTTDTFWHAVQVMAIPIVLTVLLGIGRSFSAITEQGVPIVGLGDESLWMLIWATVERLLLIPMQAVLSVVLYDDLQERSAFGRLSLQGS